MTSHDETLDAAARPCSPDYEKAAFVRELGYRLAIILKPSPVPCGGLKAPGFEPNGVTAITAAATIAMLTTTALISTSSSSATWREPCRSQITPRWSN